MSCELAVPVNEAAGNMATELVRIEATPGTEESQWLAELRQGHAVALDELSRRYRGRIVRLATRYVRDVEDAEDLAQDVLVKVWRHVGRFQGETRLWPWVARITVNAALSHLRAKRRRLPAVLVWPQTDQAASARRADPTDERLGADDQALLAQFRERATRELQRLPTVYRRAVMLMDFRQCSTAEASRFLGVPVATVKSRAIRGRRMLRRALGDFEGGFGLRSPSL